MVLYSQPVEGLIEGNTEDTWFCVLVCLFLPYFQSKSTLGVDEQLLKIAVAGDTSQLQPPPQTYSYSLAAINSILWLCYQPPNLWVTKGNKLHASGKKSQYFIHQSVGQDCFLAKDLTCCFNNSQCSEEDCCFLYKTAATSGACDKIWVDY